MVTTQGAPLILMGVRPVGVAMVPDGNPKSWSLYALQTSWDWLSGDIPEIRSWCKLQRGSFQVILCASFP